MHASSGQDPDPAAERAGAAGPAGRQQPAAQRRPRREGQPHRTAAALAQGGGGHRAGMHQRLAIFMLFFNPRPRFNFSSLLIIGCHYSLFVKS